MPLLAAVADPLLGAAEFRKVTRRRWARSQPPVRHVFEIAALKGATLVPRWGFSLDFVPHVQGGRLAWHRTEKSARLDLVYDPVDLDADWDARWGISTLHGAERVRADAERVLPAAVRRARDWLDGIHEIPSVLERAEWLRTARRAGDRFRFEDWVQQPLAHAFLLARTGARERALEVLEHWITLSSDLQDPEQRDRLRALMEG
jgi:hypothetical protein